MSSPAPPELTRRAALRQAAPMVLANAVVPLAGVADTAVIGAVGGSAELGGIALGATIFNLLYATFYFLRMGSSGLAAQAEGSGDRAELQRVLLRAIGIAAVAGTTIALTAPLLASVGFWAFQGGAAVEAVGSSYFRVRALGAPGTLAMFAVTGWLIGRGRSGAVLGVAAASSLTNIALDLILVLGFGVGVEGVAAATAAADTIGALAGLLLCASLIRDEGGLLSEARSRRRLLDVSALWLLARLSGDMMVRSWGLLAGFAWFANAGARHGDVVLAGNHVLLQVVTVWAFVLDAFAFTAETGVGRAIGQGSVSALRRAIRVTTELSLVSGATATVLTLLLGPPLLRMWIVDAGTLESALRYLPYCAVIPLVGAPAWQLDGIFVGATRSAAMRNASVVALLVYVVLDRLLQPGLGVDGMWLALVLFYVARAAALLVSYPLVERAVKQHR
jgi:MATE family multidrug resistance protein